MDCVDFLEFQDYLKKSRDVDDKLVYMINASLPTHSFQTNVDLSGSCKDLYNKLQENYEYRESLIHRCISVTTDHIHQLRSLPTDSNVSKDLKKEQTKVRLLRTELGVEEVVKERSMKLFYEKCRSFYKPNKLSL